MMKRTNLLILTLFLSLASFAQRFIDNLDRGLIAIKTSGGVYVNWRIQSNEYFDVKYNLYCNGTKIAENLNVSNFTDNGGSASSSYTVAAVVRGKEQTQCAAVKPWSQDYLEIKPKHDASLKSTYVPNDACCADVDGDGQVEILLKYDNQSEINQSYPKNGPKIYGVDTKEYSLFECLKLDGTVLWWVNCGPNMGDFQNNEQNIVAYDWDGDGKAEAVFRAADGTTIHMADGTVYTVGDASKNYRAATGGGANWFMHDGSEFLLYVNGATGKPYVDMAYPLKRLETGETDLSKAWGDGYGHRSSKYFFGAPYLDGHKPSIFLGRGIYTRHKFIAYDVDPATHQLKERWRWYNNTDGPWKGQGYHNYGIADVDMDGRDEIVWGSMVIDDNGKGLSTTGLGHGDAQHHGDFDPYTYGLEGFFCNEDKPGNNFRDLTTSKIYYRQTAGDDDGRSIMGNFSNTYPGCQGSSGRDYANAISSVTRTHLPMGTGGMAQNFRIYWDGDLCEETFNYRNGKNTEGSIDNPYKHLATLEGSMTNNDTKGTPCYQGDILGDWREEVIMRTASNNIRIFTSNYPTTWRNYSLWYDHQYRNAMVWQMCGYNQPPHASYFLGELEGYTAAPPALTMTGRTEVKNGGSITSGAEFITCENNDMTVSVANGAAPINYIDNAPSWVQGWAAAETSAANDPSKIKYVYYTHTLTGGTFSGEMNLVKQGAGALVMPNGEHTYSGKTDVWEGTLCLNGKLPNSRVFLNRHTSLKASADFGKSIEAYYNAVVSPEGADGTAGTISCDSLILRYGAVVEFDLFSGNADKVNAKVLVVEKKNWTEGPQYLAPVYRFKSASGAIADGVYDLGTVGEVKGNVDDILVEGFLMQKATLSNEGGKLMLTVKSFEAEPVTWTGTNGSDWNVDAAENFKTASSAISKFFNGAPVTFDDNASNTNVVLKSNVAPESVTFANETKEYSLSGDFMIDNTPALTKTGAGKVSIYNINNVGNTEIRGGSLYVSSLANAVGTDMGSLGTKDKVITLKNGGTLGSAANLESSHRIVCDGSEGQIDVPSNVTFKQAGALASANSGTLTKTGAGKLDVTGSMSVTGLTIKEGSVNYAGSAYSRPTVLEGKNISLTGSGFTSTPFNVSAGTTATLTLSNANYLAYSGSLTGSGTITINPTNTVNRVRITGNWSKFEGTVKVTNTSITFPLDNSTGMPNGTLNLAANTSVSNVAKTFAIGKLEGTGKLIEPISNFQSQTAVSGSNTWKVGNSWETGGDFVFSGILSDAGGTNKSNFEKVGKCKMSVGGVWANSGTVKVSEGELHINSTKSVGTGAITVAQGATFSGLSALTQSSAKKYPMTNSSLTVNGTFQCGSADDSSTGFYYFGAKSLTLKSTATYRVGLAKCATSASSPGCANLFGDGAKASLTIESGATVDVFLAPSYDPASSIGADEQKADSFLIFNDFAKVTIGDVKFNLPSLPAGYSWDTTKFKTGYLYIRYNGASGIHGIKSSEAVSVDVVAANGAVVDHFNATAGNAKAIFSRKNYAKGVYILRMSNGKGKAASLRVSK